MANPKTDSALTRDRFGTGPAAPLPDPVVAARRAGVAEERARILGLIDARRAGLRLTRQAAEHLALTELRHAIADGQTPASLATHLSDATLDAMLEQLELFAEGDREATLYLGPLLAALLDLALDTPRPAMTNERLIFVQRMLRLMMIRRTRGGEGATDVDRWCTSIARQMRKGPEDPHPLAVATTDRTEPESRRRTPSGED